jgi:hypothetical protein
MQKGATPHEQSRMGCANGFEDSSSVGQGVRRRSIIGGNSSFILISMIPVEEPWCLEGYNFGETKPHSEKRANLSQLCANILCLQLTRVGTRTR